MNSGYFRAARRGSLGGPGRSQEVLASEPDFRGTSAAHRTPAAYWGLAVSRLAWAGLWAGLLLALMAFKLIALNRLDFGLLWFDLGLNLD